MKLILDGEVGGRVSITYPSPTMLAILTNGGVNELPGDAVTADLAENEGKRVAVARSMPVARAVENMVRSGHDADFASRWVGAQLTGGETESSALEMIRRKTFIDRTGQAAIDPATLPADDPDQFFFNAWRRAGDGGEGDGVVIDLSAARLVLAKRLIERKAQSVKALADEIEALQLAGQSTDAQEAAHQALIETDLRKLGAQVQAATTVTELLSLWG